MQNLTEEDRIRFEQLEGGLTEFVEGGMEALADFITLLKLPEPYLVLRFADNYLLSVNSWMKDQVISPEDRVWLISRIGFFIGEILNQRLSGCWFVDSHPDSHYFLQYVVGQFANVPSSNARISPFALAANYVDEPPGRSLSDVITRVERQLRASNET